MKKISKNCLDLVKKFEGCPLTADRDEVGVWTIGYGITNSDKSITRTTIKRGLKISKETAEKWLEESLNKKYLPLVLKYDKQYNWNQNELDALVSFCYNIGSIKQLTANGTRSRATIAAKLLEYNKAGGKVYRGLTRRRKAEQKLFITPVKKKSNKTIAKEVLAGKWGNNPERKKKLIAAGYDYEAIRKIVNKLAK
jgi:GH24 family phage-related lysozyme (muramidase)|nr:MAG TPA: Lysozyme [Caudoviricetes sp.]